MFTHVYGLQAVPFTRTLNPNDILLTTSVKELQARLALTVRERGIAVVTGSVGSGKSTAVRAFLASLDLNRHTVITLTVCPCQCKTGPLVHRKRTHLGHVDNKVFIENRLI